MLQNNGPSFFIRANEKTIRWLLRPAKLNFAGETFWNLSEARLGINIIFPLTKVIRKYHRWYKQEKFARIVPEIVALEALSVLAKSFSKLPYTRVWELLRNL